MQLDWRKLVAEFFGTLILVVVAVGVATESFGFKLFGLSYSAGVVATALAFGFVLVALAYAIGPISGCHVNPAVTLGFIATARMKLGEGIAYIVAQVAGGIVGAYLLYAMMDTSPFYSKSRIGLGADGYGAASHLHVSQGGAFLIEVVLTAVFVMVVLFATHRAAIQGAAGVAIGFGAGGGAPDRHPADGHLGEPGPLPRPGPRRRRHGAQPGLALPGRPAGGRAGGGHHPLADRRQLRGRHGRDRRRLEPAAGSPGHAGRAPLRSGPWI